MRHLQIYFNFTRTLLSHHRSWAKLSSALFSRKVIRPNIVKVFDKDGREWRDSRISEKSNAIPAMKLSENVLDRYDEGILDSLKEADIFKGTKSKTSAKSSNIPQYERTNDKDNIFRKTMLNLSIKTRRNKMNQIVLEGSRIINDAIMSQMKLHFIFFTHEDNLKDLINLNSIVKSSGTKLVKVLFKDMKLFSSLTTSPGLMAVCEKPDYSKPLKLQTNENKMPLSLICDNVRDPGNLGTILRSAVASGVSQIILTSGCADLWNNKVIKSAAGAHFKHQIYSNVYWDELPNLLPEKFKLYIADSKANTDLMKSKISSSNYFEMNFFEPNNPTDNVLIIGNEAFGISVDSYKMLEEHSGKSISIPLHNNIESLNSAMASSILLYEIRRQFELSQQ